jgi:epoxide hydrolase-like predicted phosphatase
MPIRAVFFDLGGVIVRTEYEAPRQHLAERLGLEYEDLVRTVFESETARRAAAGAVTEHEHWLALTRRLGRPASELDSLRDDFFGGDIVDHELLDFIRSLRPRLKTGLISNAWDGLRPFIVSRKFDDAFHVMIISAEVKLMKPDERIYRLALDQAGVRANEAAFVDDLPENVEAAQALGMSGILFRDRTDALHQLNSLIDH